ncbi:hypothetical protein [Actinocorallia populi]|uniref:hypothetical protein n=1 Tax=Actinocorallia populi TaxID=2079200 RepID=UPI0013008DD5|nr:hypothetical protein [Actinocorallia populi]
MTTTLSTAPCRAAPPWGIEPTSRIDASNEEGLLLLLLITRWEMLTQRRHPDHDEIEALIDFWADPQMEPASGDD